MKKLNVKEFGGIDDQIHKCRHQLELLQQDMDPESWQTTPVDPNWALKYLVVLGVSVVLLG